jgi:hypothetical protein
MLTNFWTGLGGKLAESWAAAILSPAFAFWMGGFGAWLYGRDDGGFQTAVDDLTADFSGRSTPVQAAVIIAALLVITASGIVVQALALPVLRMLEGYWPRPLDPVRRELTKRRSQRIDDDAERWRQLARKHLAGTVTESERDEYARLDRRRREAPVRPELRMPTKLGNVLRAAEARPGDRYGLDSIVCWPRLWLVLPESARKEVTDSRKVLNVRAEIWLWAALFLVWTVFAWWAPVVGVVVAFAAYRSMISAAAVYGDLVVSCYDLHRSELYKALRWPLPERPGEEQAEGRKMTQYLSRGTVSPATVFAAASEAGGDGNDPTAS